MSIFDDGEGKRGKQEGMDRAEKHADPYWWACMLETCRAVALAKPFFFTDDLQALMRKRHPNATTHEMRAMGPIMREVYKLGYALPTPDWVESSQKQNHRGPKRVWYSLIYRGPGKHRMPRRRINDPRQFFFDMDAVEEEDDLADV
jgi:hypothetical protein